MKTENFTITFNDGSQKVEKVEMFESLDDLVENVGEEEVLKTFERINKKRAIERRERELESAIVALFMEC